MKQILLLVLAFGLFSINISAQTKRQSTTKRTSTTRSTQQGDQVMKFKQVAEDGYVWYKLKRGNLYGARDADGNNIIPIIYKDISYNCMDRWGTHWFWVSDNLGIGVYTREGDCVISTKMEYSSVSNPYTDACSNLWFNYWKKGFEGSGLLDAHGNIVIPVERGYTTCNVECDYISYTKDKKYGLCDINGNEIAPPIYYMCIRYLGEIKVKDTPNGELKPLSLSLSKDTRFNYKPFGQMFYPFKKASENSNSVSSSSSSSDASSNSGSGTSTIVVEHHRDPVPVQEWVQCTACWGSTICPNCAGSGTTYIGSNLHRCSQCGGRKICTSCSGKGGRYVTAYK